MLHKSGGFVLFAAIYIGLAAFLGIFLSTKDAHGFKQTMTCEENGPDACRPGEEPLALHWSARCVRYHINESALGQIAKSHSERADLPEVQRAVAQSFATWNSVDCSDMTLVNGGITDHSRRGSGPKASRDTNLIMWRSDDWDDVGSSRAFALTSVTFKPKNGRIIYADIEINSQLYDFSLTNTPLANHVDLENTMTHEVGHFVGLDHSDLSEATMFPTASVGEVSKRRLHADDIAGLCKAYPAGDNTPTPRCTDTSEFPAREDLNLNRPGCHSVEHPPVLFLSNILILLAFLSCRARRVANQKE